MLATTLHLYPYQGSFHKGSFGSAGFALELGFLLLHVAYFPSPSIQQGHGAGDVHHSCDD